MATALTMKKLYQTYNGFEHSTTKITIDQKVLSTFLGVTVLEIEVEETTMVKSSFARIVLEVDEMTLQLENTFQVGSVLHIEAGYQGNHKTIYYGFLHSVSYNKIAQEAMQIEVIAMDILSLMTFGNHYSQKEQKKISVLLKDISTNSVYKKYVTKMKFPTIAKSNDTVWPLYLKSDYEMLVLIANYFQYEVYIVDKVLYMDIPRKQKMNSLTLEDGLGVYQMEVECNASNLVKKVEVISYDKVGKKIKKEATINYSSFPGSKKVNLLLQEKTYQVSIGNISEIATLDAVLQGYKMAISDQYAIVHLTLAFIPDISCGSIITFTWNQKKVKCYVKKIQHYLIEEPKTMIEGCLL